MDDDISKLYTAQALIEDDLNSLLKFNSNQRATTFEGSIIYFLTKKLAFAAEYWQKSDFAHQINTGGKHLLKAENDWWDLLLAYVVNDNLTVAGGYVNWGNILNHRESNGWALQLKYEF